LSFFSQQTAGTFKTTSMLPETPFLDLAIIKSGVCEWFGRWPVTDLGAEINPGWMPA
jgi:hypothetical protein